MEARDAKEEEARRAADECKTQEAYARDLEQRLYLFEASQAAQSDELAAAVSQRDAEGQRAAGYLQQYHLLESFEAVRADELRAVITQRDTAGVQARTASAEAAMLEQSARALQRLEATAVQELDSADQGVRVLKDEVEQGQERVAALLPLRGEAARLDQENLNLRRQFRYEAGVAESRQVTQGTLQALKAQAEETQQRLEQFELAEQQREASREQARRAAEARVTTSVEATERALLEAQNRQATLAGQAEAARQSHARTAERLREATESNLELTAGAARDRVAGQRLQDELVTARADRTSYSKAWAEGHAESEAKLAKLMEEIRSVRSEHQEEIGRAHV